MLQLHSHLSRMVFFITALLIVNLGFSGCVPGQASVPTLTLESSITPGPTNTPQPTPTPTLYVVALRLSDIDGMSQVFVPAGEFQMGASNVSDPHASDDEKPQHAVYLDAYWIDQTEVTQAMYAQCVAAGQCAKPNCTLGGDGFPVVCVDWNDATNYCAWAGRQLPTEAQWEKAARGTTDDRIYPWGNAQADCGLAVIDNNCGRGNSAWAVGSKPAGASPYGALDMAGNVWEWVQDWYLGNFYAGSPRDNPTGPETGEYRVIRGGGWRNIWPYVRVAHRDAYTPTLRYIDTGFRCAATATP